MKNTVERSTQLPCKPKHGYELARLEFRSR
jgi:hypothetical protein